MVVILNFENNLALVNFEFISSFKMSYMIKVIIVV